jgi:molybdenum cofactor cytidylyltransferase
VAVILAAGGGTRFDPERPGAKLLAPFRGRPLVTWAVEHASAAGLDGTWVVTGAADLGPALPPGVRQIANPRWAAGQATSLRAALDAAWAEGRPAIVVGLGDQPLVPPEAWRAVAASSSPIALADYGGCRGHPVRLGREVWPLLPSEGDGGARGVMAARPELVQAVPCPGNPADIDTREDLQAWRG